MTGGTSVSARQGRMRPKMSLPSSLGLLCWRVIEEGIARHFSTSKVPICTNTEVVYGAHPLGVGGSGALVICLRP